MKQKLERKKLQAKVEGLTKFEMPDDSDKLWVELRITARHVSLAILSI